MIGRIFLLILFALSPTFEGYTQPPPFSWPGGAVAAICLTYDDGIDSHLDVAIPELNQSGLRGTFYLQGDNIRPDQIPGWRAAAEKGHELGNHTAFHPCNGNLDFITPEFATENYTVRRFLRELQVINTLLYAIDGQAERTFAYTCGDTEYGGVSVIDTLRQSGLFVAVRGSGRGVVSDIPAMETFDVPSWGKVEGTGEEHIEMVRKAGQAGGLLVFTFHGVGGDYLQVSTEAHRELLAYLSDHSDTYWVAPFREVMAYVRTVLGETD